MKVIYIASPYRLGDTAKNVRVQIEAAHRILDAGHCPIAPLLNHFMEIHKPRPESDWLNADIALVKKSDVVLRLPGKSMGADGEVAVAESAGIPVVRSFRELFFLLEELQEVDLDSKLGPFPKEDLESVKGRKSFPVSPAYREERDRINEILLSRPEEERRETAGFLKKQNI